MRGGLCALVVVLAAVACAATASVEGELAATEAALDQLFPDDEAQGEPAGDLGEGGDVESSPPSAGLAEEHTTEAALEGIERAANKAPKDVSYKFEGEEEDDSVDRDLGESAGVDESAGTADVPINQARQMIKLGVLLGHLKRAQAGGHERAEDVSSLKQALETKLLMDQLKPQVGSFNNKFTPSHIHNLGEDHITPSRFPSFKSILDSASSSLIGVTKYLLERKRSGNPLSAKEDSELQKFYYNRASGILKKIVLLKNGGKPEKTSKATPSDDDDAQEETLKKSHVQKLADDEIQKARDHADAVVDKLNFDSKLAIANAKYNKEMVTIRERRAKAAIEERKQAEAQELKAAEEKLKYDQKVADAQQNYNQALSTELTHRKEAAEASVRKASEDKHRADVAAAAASNAAREADAEAKEAEEEAEAATKKAKVLEQKELSREAKLAKKHRLRGHPHTKPAKKQPLQIPLTLVPKAHLAGMLRYLESALNHHQTISPAEQQLMQSFFLTKGSKLLSQLAQVNPDATWHSGGVMAEEQYEMDRHHPDQLSREWGSKHLQGDRVVTDFVHDAMWSRKDNTKMARPDSKNAVQGFLGMKSKVPLLFAPDNSPPQLTEPDLGESQSAHDVRESQPGAFTAMMGIN